MPKTVRIELTEDGVLQLCQSVRRDQYEQKRRGCLRAQEDGRICGLMAKRSVSP